MAKKPRRNKFESPLLAEREYQRQLLKVARATWAIIEPHVEGAIIERLAELLAQLQKYSELLGPWAERQARIMLDKVSNSDRRAWRSENKKITQGFRELVGDSAVGVQAKILQSEQVDLMRSIPLKAGERAQTLATAAMSEGRRADEVAKDIMKIANVTESRARLIARTEVAKANSTLNEARAVAVGSKAYIWRTAQDESVRESHAEMEGEIVRWDQPPTLSDGTTTHAGQIYNCRCYAEPILPDLDD
jgi:SPP1 gp7 family putative phage head morphogenesis protein